MKHLISLFFAFIYFLSSTAPLSAFQGDPSGIVHGSVDVISGSYLEANVDAIIAAPTPIVLKRSYTSTKGFWQFFPECALIVGKKITQVMPLLPNLLERLWFTSKPIQLQQRFILILKTTIKASSIQPGNDL